MGLPLPIAVLARRARHAKSPKERHDTAYFAWEASVRLAVAARPPADPSPLVLASTGQWVDALAVGDEPLGDPALLAAFALFSEVGLGQKATPRAVTPRKLLDALPAYRNHVLGHGATRSAEFYPAAATALLEALDAAWAAGIFWPDGPALVYVDAVELDPGGARRARTLDLTGFTSTVENLGVGTAVPEGVLPGRLYLRHGGGGGGGGGRYQSLHPWLLYREADLRESVLFFNGRKRSSEYLDYASGEPLRGKELAAAFPAIEADVGALFRGAAASGSAPAAEPSGPEKADPSLFGDYRILGKLGQGGMGVVYLARQESLGRLVALKVLPLDVAADPVAVARFRREVAALSKCDHPNVVKILASGEAQGAPYYAMELIEGADLSQVARALSTAGDFDAAVSTAAERVRKAKADVFASAPDLTDSARLPGLVPAGRAKDRFRRLASLFRDAARGLHHIHEQGIIHRDLKPANLMITAGEHRVVVMDLGLAALGDATRSITKDKSALLGTLRYMPPEQLQRNLLELDRRADVYALGATLYELVTDRPFFDGDSEARLIQQVLREEPVPPAKANPRLPRDLATIIEKATEKDPRLRYDSAAALASDLEAFLDGRAIAARPPTLGYVLRLVVARNKALAATVALAVLLAVAGTVFFVAREAALRRDADERRKEAEMAKARAEDGEREAAQAREGERTAREAAEAREREASANLARLFYEKADRALAAGDSLAAEVLFARALASSDTGDARERILGARVTGARLAFAAPAGVGAVDVAFSPDGRRLASAGVDHLVRLWDVETGEQVQLLRGHAGSVMAVAFSADGRLLASASVDETVRIWDVATGSESRILRHEADVFSVAFHPDGRRLASSGGDTAVRIWDVGAGTEILSLQGHESVVRCVALARDGRLLASASHDETVRIWDIETGKEVHVLRGHDDAIYDVAFSSDGRRLASACKDGTIRLWDAPSGAETLVLSGQAAAVLDVAFDSDGRRLASASGDGTVRVWDLERGMETLVLRGHAAEAMSVAFHPDGRTLASGGHDHAIRLWDLETGKQTLASPPGHADLVATVAVSPDGRLLVSASGDGTIRLWDVETGKQGLVLRGPRFHCVALSPDGRRLASADQDNTVRVWDVETGAEALVLPGHEGTVFGVAWSPDGGRLASASEDRTVRLWSVGERREIAVLRGHERWVSGVAWSPDGRRLASAGEDTTVRLWDVETAKETGVLRGHEDGPVYGVAFSPDGRSLASTGDGEIILWDVETSKASQVLTGLIGERHDSAFSPDGYRLVSAGRDGDVRIWNVETGVLTGRISGQGASVVSVAWSPDGRRVAAGGKDGSLRLWDIGVTEQTLALLGHRAPAWSVAFSPDGRRLASAGMDEVRVWQVEPPERPKAPLVFRGHAGEVFDVAWSPDGRRLGSAGEDGTVRVWDPAAEQKEPLVLRGHTGRVSNACFSPDGQRLASAGDDGTLRLWDLGTGKEVLRLGAFEEAVIDVAWSPDGRLASAGADSTIRLWDAAMGKETFVLRGHEEAVLDIAFSPDARRLASASRDRTIRLWDIGTGYETFVYRGTHGYSLCVAFSRDGRRLAASTDMVLRTWDVETERQVRVLGRHGHLVTGADFSPDGRWLAAAVADGSVRLWDLPAVERFLRTPAEAILAESERRTGLRVDGTDVVVESRHRLVPVKEE